MLAPPDGVLAAALVEGHQYAYLYRPAPRKQEYGQQQVGARVCRFCSCSCAAC